MRRDPIKVVPYDARWPAAFARERARVEAALGTRLVGRVEHIGSTAVPGLAAKPIIDLLALVEDYDRASEIVAALGEIGWVHAPEPGDRERTWPRRTTGTDRCTGGARHHSSRPCCVGWRNA